MAGGVRFNIFAFDKTKRAFDSVERRVSGLKKSFVGLKNKLGGIGVAMLAAFTGAGIKAMIDATDKVQKLSMRLGVTTAALSELKFAGEQTGVEFNQLALGLQRMTRRVSEAAMGLGEARGALAELGLSAIELNQLSPDQQFMKIADALNGVTNQADKVRLAFKLFDSEGVALIQTMDGGSEAVQRLRDQLKDLNGVIDQQSADRLASLNDSWNRFTTAAEGAARQLLTFLAPAIEFVTDGITQLVSWVGDLIKVFRWLEHSIASDIVRMQEFVGIIDKSEMDKRLGQIAQQWDEISTGSKKAAKSVDGFKDSVIIANKEMDKLAGKGGNSGGSVDTIKDKIKDIGDESETAGAAIKDAFKDAIRSAGDDFRSLEDVARNVYNRIQSNILNKSADILADAIFGGQSGGGLLGGLFKSGGGGGSSGLMSMFSMAAGGGGFGGFFADGGNFQAGKPIVVGERGPEMIMPRHAGTVIPNHGMPARAMNVHMTINTPDANSFRQSQSQITAEMAMAMQRAGRNL